MNDQPQVSKKSIMLNYGLLLGFASIIIGLINYVAGDIYQPHWSLIVGSIVVTIAIIILGIKKIKESNSGFLSISDAIKAGLGISLIAALVNIVYLMIFYNIIEPTYFEDMAKVQEQVIIEKYPNLTDQELEGALKGSAMFLNTGANVTMTLIFSLFSGLIISLIGGLIMRKSEEG